MPARLTRLMRKPCLHEQTMVVRSSHVERKVCESCGYLSFSMNSEGRSERPRRPERALQPTYPNADTVL